RGRVAIVTHAEDHRVETRRQCLELPAGAVERGGVRLVTARIEWDEACGSGRPLQQPLVDQARIGAIVRFGHPALVDERYEHLRPVDILALAERAEELAGRRAAGDGERPLPPRRYAGLEVVGDRLGEGKRQILLAAEAAPRRVQ